MIFILKKFKEFFLRRSMSNIDYLRRKGVVIGDECRIYINDFGSEPWLVSIGNKVTITAGVRIITHDGSTWLFNDNKGRRYSYKRVSIGNNVFIGVNSIILPGVKIEDDVIVAAGSIVTKSIPKGTIVAGNPARIIGNFYDFRKKALDTFVSDSQIDHSKTPIEKINEIVDKTIKPFL